MNRIHQPLLRHLAINLAIGAAIAVLMFAGVLAVNPHGLRTLMLADRLPGVAFGLLFFGFLITFGSVVMGTAIMALGQSEGGGKRRPDHPVLARLSVSAPPAAPGAQR